MSRRAARTDANHADVVRALLAVGASVQSLAAVGCGCPDLLVGWRGLNYLLEVKDGSLPPSHRKLGRAQKKLHAMWRGQIAVVENDREALAAIGVAVEEIV